MAAVDLTGTKHGTPKSITLPGAGLAREVQLPKGTKVITLNYASTAGKYSNTGTDGGAIGVDATPVAADLLVEQEIRRDMHQSDAGVLTVFLSSDPGAGVVVITPETR